MNSLLSVAFLTRYLRSLLLRSHRPSGIFKPAMTHGQVAQASGVSHGSLLLANQDGREARSSSFKWKPRDRRRRLERGVTELRPSWARVRGEGGATDVKARSSYRHRAALSGHCFSQPAVARGPVWRKPEAEQAILLDKLQLRHRPGKAHSHLRLLLIEQNERIDAQRKALRRWPADRWPCRSNWPERW